MTNAKKTFSFLIFLLPLLLISACGKNIPTATPELTLLPQNTETAPSGTSSASEQIPTEVPIVTESFFIYLENAEEYYPIEANLEELSNAAVNDGMVVQSSNEIPASGQAFTYVLLFDPSTETLSIFDNGIATELLIVAEELTAEPKTHTTLFTISPADRLFISGYLSAIISTDWRVGGLLPNTEIRKNQANLLFENGMAFLCGRCTPTSGPLAQFPATATLSSPENTNETLQQFGELSKNRINTLFIPSAYLFDDFIILLQQNGVQVVSDIAFDGTKKDWVDYAVVDNLSSLIKDSLNNLDRNEPFTTIPVEYSIYSKNNELSVGKLNFINDLIKKLQTGLISPYSYVEE